MGDQGQGGQGMEVEKVVKKRPVRAVVQKVWEIRNLSELLEMSDEELELEKNGITFDAGHSIGIPATWRFYLTHSEEDDSVGGYLLLSPESKAKAATASYSITLSCLGKTFTFQELEPYEYKVLEEGGGEWGWTYSETEILQKTDNGKKPLKITLRVKVFSEDVKTLKLQKENLLKREGMASDFGRLLDSGDGVDVEVKVPKEAGGEFDDSSYSRQVHKAVLMARSSVFAKMFSTKSEMIEAKTGKVFIKDLSPTGLDVFLRYIYTGKVLEDWLKIPEEILSAADKYDLRRLKHYCGHNIMSAVSPSNALEMYEVVKLHKLSFAKSVIAEFVSKNARAVLDDKDDLISDDSYEEHGEQSDDE